MADAPDITVTQPWSPSKGGLVDLGIDGTSPSGSPFSITGNGTFTFPCAGAGSVWLEISGTYTGTITAAFSATQGGNFQVARPINNTLRSTAGIANVTGRFAYDVEGPWCQIIMAGYASGTATVAVTFGASPLPISTVTIQPPSSVGGSPSENPVYIAALDTGGRKRPPLVDVSGNQFVIQGNASSLNITAPTVIAVGVRRLVRVNVLVAGSAAGTVYDTTGTSSVAASNAVFSIPNTVGSYFLDWPMASGIVASPGTGQTVAVSYE